MIGSTKIPLIDLTLPENISMIKTQDTIVATPDTIGFMTCNLNGKYRQAETRLGMLLSQLETTHLPAPKVICFQELTPDLIHILEARLSSHYHILTHELQPDLAILIDHQIAFRNLTPVRFPISGQQHGCLGLEIRPPYQQSRTFWIWNGQLEIGLGAHDLRRDQWNFMLGQYAPNSDVIWLGDTGIISDDERQVAESLETLLVEQGWQDIWRLMKCPQQSKYTFDVELNPMANAISTTKVSHRPDRILFKGNYKLTPNWWSLWGSSMTQTSMAYPSSHFGVLANITFGPS